LPSQPKKSQFPWLGCLFVCLGLAVVIPLVGAITLRTLLQVPPFAPKAGPDHPAIPSEYVGDWQLAGGEPGQIRILPDGRAECHVMKGIAAIDLSGARARLTPDQKTLSIKLFFFGPTWRVDEPPHWRGDQFEMTLDGKVYRRVREYDESPDRNRVTV
jgi:hypothetical protein